MAVLCLLTNQLVVGLLSHRRRAIGKVQRLVGYAKARGASPSNLLQQFDTDNSGTLNQSELVIHAARV